MLRPNGITRAFARAVLKTKKQSPHIFFGVGVAGVISGGVLACRATLKLEDELDAIKENLDTIAKAKEEGIVIDAKGIRSGDAASAGVQDEFYRKLVVKAYVNAGVRLTKLYGLPAALTGVGIACLVGSHVQLTRRNAALQATLIAVQSAYDEYRQRVREEIGEERENAIYRNVADLAKADASTEIDPSRFSPYAKVFDEYNPNWRPDAEHNRMHIQAQQNYANHMLNARGHVFLNEVYDVLGFEHTRAGSIVGWILGGPNSANGVDFGMLTIDNAAFINGLEKSVWLDFNVDGVIFDQI